MDLARTPPAAAAKEIGWDEVQVDDCFTGPNGVAFARFGSWVLLRPAARLSVMAITIRSAGTGDCALIAALLDQLGYPAQADDVATRLEYWLADPHSALLVAEADGVVAGVAALHAFPLLEHTGRRGRLVALVVDDRVRGQGIGKALMEAAEERARGLGCHDMEITSARDRTAAHRFYAGLGYDDVCGRAARFVKALHSV